MKFLCVPCDVPMKLASRAMPEPGSIALVYSCPDCGYEFAMLTNAHETEVVSSLGVRIGGEEASSGSKCPFTGMVRELERPAAGGSIPWTAAAQRRMANVPELVLPMVRTGIERFARERGYAEIDERVLDEAKGHLGM
jgi:hypothetical protein